jgi:hypothetical protein
MRLCRQPCCKNSVGVRLQSLLAKSLSAGNYGTCFYGRAAGTGARASVFTRVRV